MTRRSANLVAGITIAITLGIGLDLYIASGQARGYFAALIPLPLVLCLAAVSVGNDPESFDPSVEPLPAMRVHRSR